MAEQQTLFEQPQEQLERFHLRNPKLFSSYYLAFKLPKLALWQHIQVQAQKAFD